MTTQEVIQSREFQSVVYDYRETCLWFYVADTIRFHEGRIGGAWPTVRG